MELVSGPYKTYLLSYEANGTGGGDFSCAIFGENLGGVKKIWEI